MITTYINKLVSYGVLTGLVAEEDRIFTTNALLELFGLDEIEAKAQEVKVEDLEDILKGMLDYAAENV